MATSIKVSLTLLLAVALGYWSQAASRSDNARLIQSPSAATASLFTAVSRDDVASVVIDIKHGADINAVDSAGFHPINIAAMHGSTAVGNILLSHDVDFEATDALGENPLMEAAANGHYDFLILMLLQKASVRAVDDHNETAILLATKLGDERCIIALLNAGSDASKPDAYGNTPLIEACRNSGVTPRAFARLIAQSAVDHANSVGVTALMNAAYSESPYKVKALLAAGANPHAVDKFGASALHYCVTSAEFNGLESVPLSGGQFTGSPIQIDLQNRSGETASILYALSGGTKDGTGCPVRRVRQR